MELDGVKLIDITHIPDRNLWMYMHTKKHPHTVWTTKEIEGKTLAFETNDDVQGCFLFYNMFFEFNVENGRMNMLIAPMMKPEHKRAIKNKADWKDGELIISPVNQEDPEYRRFQSIPFKSLNITKARKISIGTIRKMRDHIKAEVKSLTNQISTDMERGFTDDVSVYLKEIDLLQEEYKTHFKGW